MNSSSPGGRRQARGGTSRWRYSAAVRSVLILARQRIRSRLAHPADLFAGALSNTLIAATGPVVLTAMASSFDDLRGWSFAEVAVIWGFAECVVGLFYVLFQGLMVFNVRYVLGGELDRVLTRPVDPLLHVLADNLSLEDLPVAALGLGVVVWGAAGVSGVPPWVWLLFPVQVLAALAVLAGVMVAFSAAGFHLRHRGTAIGLVFQLGTYARWPLDLFGEPLRWLLTAGIPLGFAGFYPATVFLGRPEWAAWGWATPAVGAVCAAGGWIVWHRSARAYGSVGA